MNENHWMQAARQYGDAHRRWAQLFLRRGAIEVESACLAFLSFLAETRETNRADATVTSLTAEQRVRLRDALLAAMNAELETVAFRLVCAEDDYDGSTEWLILVSERQFDQHFAEAAELSADELAVLKRWIEEMLKPENAGSLDQLTALNMDNAMPNAMGKKKTQELIQRLVARNWIVTDPRAGTLRLHQRTLVELRAFIAGQFAPCECPICQRFVVHRDRHVACGVCKSMTHRFCLAKLLKSTKSEQVLCAGQLENGRRCTQKYDKNDARLVPNAVNAHASVRAKVETTDAENRANEEDQHE